MEVLQSIKIEILKLLEQATSFQSEIKEVNDMYHYYTGAKSYLHDALQKIIDVEIDSIKKGGE